MQMNGKYYRHTNDRHQIFACIRYTVSKNRQELLDYIAGSKEFQPLIYHDVRLSICK